LLKERLTVLVFDMGKMQPYHAPYLNSYMFLGVVPPSLPHVCALAHHNSVVGLRATCHPAEFRREGKVNWGK